MKYPNLQLMTTMLFTSYYANSCLKIGGPTNIPDFVHITSVASIYSHWCCHWSITWIYFPIFLLYKNLSFQSIIICVQSFQSSWIATQNDGLSHPVIIIVVSSNFYQTNFSNIESQDDRYTLHYTLIPNKHIQLKLKKMQYYYSQHPS